MPLDVGEHYGFHPAPEYPPASQVGCSQETPTVAVLLTPRLCNLRYIDTATHHVLVLEFAQGIRSPLYVQCHNDAGHGDGRR